MVNHGRIGVAVFADDSQSIRPFAERDNTAIAFRDAWHKCRHRTDATIVSLDSASHSYAGAADKAWLFGQLIEAASSRSR